MPSGALPSPPPPQVVDVDGDGAAEVLVATADRRLLLLHQPAPVRARRGRAGGGGAAAAAGARVPLIVASASLLAGVRVGAGRSPVALGSGYVTPFEEGGRRPRIVVVLTDGWDVLAYACLRARDV